MESIICINNSFFFWVVDIGNNVCRSIWLALSFHNEFIFLIHKCTKMIILITWNSLKAENFTLKNFVRKFIEARSKRVHQYIKESVWMLCTFIVLFGNFLFEVNRHPNAVAVVAFFSAHILALSSIYAWSFSVNGANEYSINFAIFLFENCS